MRLVFSFILAFNFSISYYRYVDTKIEVFFTGTDNCQEKIIQCIDKAQNSITFALYYLSNKPLIDSLIRASERGVLIQGVVDSQFLSQVNNKKAISSLKKKMHIKIIRKKTGLMHHKFAVIDKKIIITGSYNWTFSANTKNDENMLIIKDEDLAVKYLREFKKLKMR